MDLPLSFHPDRSHVVCADKIERDCSLCRVPSAATSQSGVIPYRWNQHQLEILLITTRRHGWWTIPKGGIKSKIDAARSACQEAYEEAGILGQISAPAIGWYRYHKRAMCWWVTVFVFEVQVMLETWPEMHKRKRHWFPAPIAARMVREPALQMLIATLQLRT